MPLSVGVNCNKLFWPEANLLNYFKPAILGKLWNFN